MPKNDTQNKSTIYKLIALLKSKGYIEIWLAKEETDHAMHCCLQKWSDLKFEAELSNLNIDQPLKGLHSFNYCKLSEDLDLIHTIAPQDDYCSTIHIWDIVHEYTL